MCRAVFGPSLAAAALVAAGLIAGTARACDTPVYRYAMYYWFPDPYPVLYFYENEPAEEDQAVNARVGELGHPGPEGANLYFQAIDLAEEPIDQFPQPLQETIEEHRGKPFHVILNSWGDPIFSGRLTVGDVESLVTSPKRTQLSELLHEGNGVVLLLLESDDSEGNEAAERTVHEAIGQLEKLQEQLQKEYEEYMASMEREFQKSREGEDTPEPQAAATPSSMAYMLGAPAMVPMKVAVVRVEPNDKKETWLVAMLKKLRHPAADPEAPAVYAVYGRGRALPAMVGEQITTENLVAMLDFLAGACSCTVKAQNPGCDLVLQWDWESTAEKLAATDTSLAADPYAYGSADLGMLPQLSEPLGESDPASTEMIAGAGGSDTSPHSDAGTADSEAEAGAIDTGNKGGGTASFAQTGVRPQPEGSVTDDAPAGPQTPPGETARDFAPSMPTNAVRRISWTRYALVLGVGAVVVLALGAVMFGRNKQRD